MLTPYRSALVWNVADNKTTLPLVGQSGFIMRAGDYFFWVMAEEMPVATPRIS